MQNIILLNTVSNASTVQAHQVIYLLVLTYQQRAVLLKRKKKGRQQQKENNLVSASSCTNVIWSTILKNSDPGIRTEH